MVHLKDPFWNNLANGSTYADHKSFANLFQEELPEKSSLPQPIQTFLTSIEDLPDYEKISLTHDFVSDHMKYPDNKEDIYTNDRILSVKSTIKSWQYGDCDNQAQLSSVLLRYAGISPSRLTFMKAQVNYDDDGDGVGHAVLVVKNQEQHLLMDMNLRDVVPIRANEDLTFTATGKYRDTISNLLSFGSTEVTLKPDLLVPIEKGEPVYMSPKLANMVKEDTDDVPPMGNLKHGFVGKGLSISPPNN